MLEAVGQPGVDRHGRVVGWVIGRRFRGKRGGPGHEEVAIGGGRGSGASRDAFWLDHLGEAEHARVHDELRGCAGTAGERVTERDGSRNRTVHARNAGRLGGEVVREGAGGLDRHRTEEQGAGWRLDGGAEQIAGGVLDGEPQAVGLDGREAIGARLEECADHVVDDRVAHEPGHDPSGELRQVGVGSAAHAGDCRAATAVKASGFGWSGRWWRRSS